MPAGNDMLRALSAAGSGAHQIQTQRSHGVPAIQRPPKLNTSRRPRELLCMATTASNAADGGEAPMSPADVPTALHSMRIRTALRVGRRPVACQGVVQLSSPVTVYARNQARQHFAVQLPPGKKAALQPLLDACVPAVFGRGSEEVLDSSYRQAVALSPDLFSTSFDLAAHSILWDVRSLLRPDANSIRAHLHMLNVYGPGGFFKTHKDTPRSVHQFGSLVICLPVPHEGGDLVVRHGGCENARTEWGSKKDSTRLLPKARWAAFYSDCEHEVEPVTKGYRITLTYELSVDGNALSAMPPTPVVDASATASIPVYAALRAALDDPKFLPQGGTLGLACSHQYYRSADVRRLSERALKGDDALVFDVARRLWLQPDLKYVFNIKSEYDSESDLDDDEDEPRPSKGYQLTDTYIQFYDDEWYEGDVRGLLFDRKSATTADHVQWLNEADLQFDNSHWVTMYGNQRAPPSVVYSAAAILLNVPPVDSSGCRASAWGYDR